MSPYAKQDHNVHSFGSWLRVVEERFEINSMTARDTTAGDMLDASTLTRTAAANDT